VKKNISEKNFSRKKIFSILSKNFGRKNKK